MTPDQSKDMCARYQEKTIAAFRANPSSMYTGAASIGLSYAAFHNRLQCCIRHGFLSRDEYQEQCISSKMKKEDQKDFKKEVENLKHKVEAYEKLANHHSNYKVATYKPNKSNAVAVFVASDWHAGEAVDPADLPGNLNEYNPGIFKKRAEQFFQRSVYLTNTLARSIADVDTAVFAILGDVMTGFLHEDQQESNHLSPIEEVLLLEETINAGIDYILKNAKLQKLIIPCCPGNHGRTTEKIRAKTLADSSYETLLYRHLSKRWANDKRVEWHVATGYQVMVKLWDYTIRFHHGDAVNYGGGVGGITIPLRKAIAGWNSVAHADLDVLGHFHSHLDGGDFICNGSLIGYNAYALRVKAKYEAPQQSFFLVDKHRGKTLTARIFTDYMP